METKRIKIALIIPNLKIAGAQNVVVKIAANVDRNKFQPIIIVINEKENNKFQQELEEKNIDCIYYGKKCKLNVVRKVKQFIWLKQKLDEINPDIIHVHLDYYFSFLYSLLKRKKIITTIHSQPYRIYNIWTNFFMNKLDKLNLIKIVCLTRGGKEELLKTFKIKKSRVCVIPNPVETEKFRINCRTFQHKEIIKFVYVARFEAVKNHHLLIEAFHEALQENPCIQLYLVGKGQFLTKEEKFVKDLNIKDKVFFIGEVDNVSELLKDMDVFVISSDSESFSLSMVEAMAAGMPIIATEVGAIPEIMQDNGILVPKRDSQRLSEAMIKLVKERDLCKEYSTKSFELAQKYDIGGVIKQYEQLYVTECELNNI